MIIGWGRAQAPQLAWCGIDGSMLWGGGGGGGGVGLTWGLVFQRESEAGGQVPPPPTAGVAHGSRANPLVSVQGYRVAGLPGGS